MFCSSCGRDTQAGFFCHACDAFLGNPRVGSNAGLARRIVAQLLDAAVALSIVVVAGAASCAVGTAGSTLGSLGTKQADAAAAFAGCSGCLGTFLLAVSGYTVLALWFLAQGQTPGKWLVGIRVADKRDGANPGFGRMFVREGIGKCASACAGGLGYFWAIWDPDNQTWHDKIAGTVVLKPMTVADGPQPRLNSQADIAAAAVRPSPTLVPGIGIPAGELEFCTRCGAPMPNEVWFCEACGAARVRAAHAPPHV